MPSEQQLAKRSLEIINEYVTNNGKPMYLSQLGNKLSTYYGRAPKQIVPGKTLADILKEQLGSALQYQGQGPTLAAYPSDWEGALETRDASRIVYPSKFWAAFAKPLPPNFRRYMQLEPPYEFHDTDQEWSDSDEFVEIPRNLIAPGEIPPGPQRNTHVRKLIEHWLKERDDLTFNFTEQAEIADAARKETGRTLGWAFGILSQEELSRVWFPGDIVYKLIQRRDSKT